MKLKLFFFVTLILAYFGPSYKAYALMATAKATIIVVDEDGKPIEGANTGIAFEKNKMVGAGIEIVPVDGLTDAQGRFTAQHRNDSDVITYGTNKDGYYSSSGEYRFLDRGPIWWKPWNPELKIVLRKIENPTPMYAKKIDGDIPVIGEKAGFDLLKGDWVAPYGRGTNSDFIFLLEKEVKSKKDMKSKLYISFYNKYDGIILIKNEEQFGSQFKLNRHAPLNGFLNNIILSVIREPGKWFEENFKEDDNYIFRVRSEVDDNGNLKKGMYGKIIGPIKFAPLRSKTAAIEFKYYLNPDYTRNLEFDPKRNLFESLPPLEQVGIQ